MKRIKDNNVVIATISIDFRNICDGQRWATNILTIVFNADGRNGTCESTQKKEGSYGKSTNKDNISNYSRTPELKTDSIHK